MMTLDVDAIQEALNSEHCGAITVLDTVDSTNRWLADRVRDGKAGHGDFVIADCQTHGRGRRNRLWHSPTGLNCYASICFEAPRGPIGFLVYVAGLAVAETVETVCGLDVFLKWPNDVHFRRKKLCGILCEAVGVSSSTMVVVGIGLNVNTPIEAFDPELGPVATSLLIETGREYDRNLMAAALYRALAGRYNDWVAEPVQIISAWKARAGVPGVRYVICLDSGVTVEGTAQDLAADGALILRADGERVALYSGDVISYRVE